MNHLSDEDLSVLVPGESLDAATSAHLSDCTECRRRRRELEEILLLVSSSEALPSRGDGYGRDVWARISPRLDEPRTSGWRALLAPRRLAFAGILVLVLVATFLAGRFWQVPQAPLSAGVRERILVVALGEHLERSQAVLIELVNAPAGADVDVSSEQTQANDLLAANRLYRQTASRNGDASVSAVLEELERLLLEVAHGPSHLTPEDLASLRERIEQKGVLFKVRVIGANLRERGELPGSQALERKRT
jgi:anti-sigma factor RsiW